MAPGMISANGKWGETMSNRQERALANQTAERIAAINKKRAEEENEPMMNEALIHRIVKGIEECEAMNGTHIYVSKEDAVQLVKILAGEKAESMLTRVQSGHKLFYCPDCAHSFWAEPREDIESFEKWQYHAWYAVCPGCRREVRQTDRYWR